MIFASTKPEGLVRHPIVVRTVIAALLAIVVLFPVGSQFVDEAEAYSCTVYAYTPQDWGTYARAQGEAYCPATFEYKALSTCLIKSGYGIVRCSYDSGYQTSYYAAASGCYGTGYYQTRVILTNQPARYSSTVYITC